MKTATLFALAGIALTAENTFLGNQPRTSDVIDTRFFPKLDYNLAVRRFEDDELNLAKNLQKADQQFKKEFDKILNKFKSFDDTLELVEQLTDDELVFMANLRNNLPRIVKIYQLEDEGDDELVDLSVRKTAKKNTRKEPPKTIRKKNYIDFDDEEEEEEEEEEDAWVAELEEMLGIRYPKQTKEKRYINFDDDNEFATYYANNNKNKKPPTKEKVPHPNVIKQYITFDDEELGLVNFLKSAVSRKELPTKRIHFDDEEFGLVNFLKSAISSKGEHPSKKVPFTAHELNLWGNIKKGVSKTGGFVTKHPEIARTVLKFDDEEDNTLFSLGELLKDGLHIYNDVKTHNYADLIEHGKDAIKHIKKHK